MIANCFFWKWADNDLPGKPTDVCSALLRGELHPAIQPFDARPVIEAIEALPFENLLIERNEYKWDVITVSHSVQAQFVRFTYPRPFEVQEIYHLLAHNLLPLGICCFDESLGMVGDWFAPKINEFQLGFWPGDLPGEIVYDISSNELSDFLKRINVRLEKPGSFAMLSDRRSHFVQCFGKRHGFVVEWGENYYANGSHSFVAWKALANSCGQLSYEGVQDVFQAFFLRQPRPSQFQWREITHLFEN
jgi:hypothetical protein